MSELLPVTEGLNAQDSPVSCPAVHAEGFTRAPERDRVKEGAFCFFVPEKSLIGANPGRFLSREPRGESA